MGNYPARYQHGDVNQPTRRVLALAARLVPVVPRARMSALVGPGMLHPQPFAANLAVYFTNTSQHHALGVYIRISPCLVAPLTQTPFEWSLEPLHDPSDRMQRPPGTLRAWAGQWPDGSRGLGFPQSDHRARRTRAGTVGSPLLPLPLLSSTQVGP